MFKKTTVDETFLKDTKERERENREGKYTAFDSKGRKKKIEERENEPAPGGDYAFIPFFTTVNKLHREIQEKKLSLSRSLPPFPNDNKPHYTPKSSFNFSSCSSL